MRVVIIAILLLIVLNILAADTLYFSAPRILNENEILCNLHRKNDTLNCDTAIDEDIVIQDSDDLYWRRPLHLNCALKTYYADTSLDIVLFDSLNNQVSNAQFSLFEILELADYSMFSATYRSSKPITTHDIYSVSENAMKYYENDMNIFRGKEFSSPEIDEILNNNDIYTKVFSGYELDEEIFNFLLVVHEAKDTSLHYESKIYSLAHTHIFCEHDGDINKVFDNIAYFAPYKFFVSQIMYNNKPILVFRTGIPRTGELYDAFAYWDGEKYVLKEAFLVVE